MRRAASAIAKPSTPLAPRQPAVADVSDHAERNQALRRSLRLRGPVDVGIDAHQVVRGTDPRPNTGEFGVELLSVDRVRSRRLPGCSRHSTPTNGAVAAVAVPGRRAQDRVQITSSVDRAAAALRIAARPGPSSSRPT